MISDWETNFTDLEATHTHTLIGCTVLALGFLSLFLSLLVSPSLDFSLSLALACPFFLRRDRSKPHFLRREEFPDFPLRHFGMDFLGFGSLKFARFPVLLWNFVDVLKKTLPQFPCCPTIRVEKVVLHVDVVQWNAIDET